MSAAEKWSRFLFRQLAWGCWGWCVWTPLSWVCSEHKSHWVLSNSLHAADVLWPATEGCNLQTSKPIVSCCSVLASRYTGCSSAVMKPTGCGWKASIRGQWTTGPTSYLVETRGCFLQALQLLRSSWKFTGGKKKGKRERFLFLDGSDSPASAA